MKILKAQAELISGILAVMMSVGLLGGCASVTSEPSGFQPSYSGFEPSPKSKGRLVYKAPGFDIGKYDKIIIDHCLVFISPDAKYRAVDPDALKRLTDSCRNALVKSVEDEYPVVTEAGPDVIRLQVAITDVVPAKPVANTITTLLPPAFILGSVVGAAGGTAPGVGSVAIEAMLVDSQTGERYMGLIDKRIGKKYQVWNAVSTWGQVDTAFNSWAKDFRKFLDESRK